MLSVAEINVNLAQCYGSENLRYNPLTLASGLGYTDGIKAMCEMCGAWWLLDAICSYQAECKRHEMLRDMQFWTLTVEDNEFCNSKSAVLECKDGNSEKAIIRQEIEYTDFPLQSMRIWVEAGALSINGKVREAMIAMLPSER